MASLGAFQVALTSGQQTSILSAANFNFDFTLVKVAAPIEYEGLGKSLSIRRKTEAEDGPLHTIARKLGALFAGEVPKVPNLISAYGKRASEISQDPKANPTTSKTYSVFADHVGADGTSLWAAATSGKSTITIHLLACMLARMWKPAQAVSLWVDLVSARKDQLQERVENDEFQMSDATSARIEITRDQLTLWDSSARSWLRSADSACERWQLQLLLIVNNLDAQIPPASNVYTAIVKTWHDAMQLLDNLIIGIPQSVHDAELLLGLSSWHIYPDMAVVRTKVNHIEQKDKLVAPGGIVTLGLCAPEKEGKKGVLWSLPLSHLRYYGKPTRVTSELNIFTRRITFKQFLFISLGSLTRSWPGGYDLVLRMVLAFSRVWPKEGKQMPAWLELYFDTAQWYDRLDGKEKEQAEQLFYFGRRRCETLFGGSDEKNPRQTHTIPKVSVAFGLCRISNFVHALPGAERRIMWLREFSASLGSKHNLPGTALIKYYPDPADDLECLQLAAQDRSNLGDRACTQLETANLSNSSHALDENLSNNDTDAKDESQGRTSDGDLFKDLGLGHKKLDNTMHGESGDVKTNTEASVSRGKERGRVATSSCKRAYHTGHADTLVPKLLAEFATLRQSLIANRAASGRRWVPANENVARLASQNSDLRCSWWLRGFVSPLSASVYRAKSLQEQTGEDCGLYNTAELDQSGLQEHFPRLDPIQPRRLHDLNARSALIPEEPVSHLSSDSTKRLRSRKRRKITYGGGCPSKWYMPNLDGSAVQYHAKVAFGDSDTAMILLPGWAGHKATDLSQNLDPDHVISAIEAGLFSVDSLSDILESPVKSHWIEKHQIWGEGESDEKWLTKKCADNVSKSLDALVMAAQVYRGLPNSTIDIGVTSNPLPMAKYLKGSASMLAKNFSCVAMFESGTINIDPTELEDVIAISSGNSLHIAAFCLQDPAQDESTGRILHTVGNVGKPGMSFLISPKNPMVKEPALDQWQLVRHLPFDGELESNLTNTTLHLSFTGYELPLRTTDHGTLNKDAFFVEAAVRAFDGREWVGDIDLVSAFQRMGASARRLGTCNHSPEEKKQFQHLNLASVDSWTELLDAPMTAHVVRAKNDWISRLAAFAVATQTRRSVLIASECVCWRCVEELATTFLKFQLTEDASWRLGVKGDWSKLMILC